MKPTRCYLLAAGKGRRAGGPKAWLELDGLSLLERQLRFLSTLVEPASISVSVQAGWEERCSRLMPGARFVPVDPGAPPLASLLALLRDKDFSGWCSVHHVDMPVWSETLFSPPAEAEADAVIPVYEGRGGHPVLLRERLIAPLLELDPERDRLDAFLRTRDTLRRETDRPEAVANWNQGPPS